MISLLSSPAQEGSDNAFHHLKASPSVETLVESGLGLPHDRGEAWAAARQAADQSALTRPPAIAPIAYRMRTAVPPYWIPFVPVVGEDNVWLRRAMMPDDAGEPIPPEGRILEGSGLDLYDEEVPPEGARVTRSFQYTRGPDGSTYLWVARRRRPGALRTFSGLRFDSAEPTR